MQFTKEQIDMIRSERTSFEQTRQISNNVLDLIYDKKLFKLVVPKQFGGKMLDLPTAAKVFQQSSYIDGNFGWLVTIGSGGGMFVPNMTEQMAEQCYSLEEAVIAGSGFPAGTAKKTENGYIINGKWLYCSGSQYATTFTVTCKVENDSKEQEIVAFALQREQVNVLNDWNAVGLKGTSSHSIEVNNEFVEENCAFSVFDVKNNYGTAVHTFPFISFSEASFVSICLGISEHFLEEVGYILDRNKENWQHHSPHRYTLLSKKLQEEKKRWQTACDIFHQTLKEVWHEHMKNGEVTTENVQRFSTVSKRTVSTTLYCVNNLFRYLGMEMIMVDSDINQIWRDLHTASQHTFLMPQNEDDVTPY